MNQANEMILPNGRTANTQGAAKPIAAATAQQIVWSGNDLESNGVVGYVAVFDGATNAFDDVARIRVKSNGVSVWDVDAAHYASYLQRISFSNYAPAAADQFVYIPLNILDAATDRLADTCQFPANTQATVELSMKNTVVAGSAFVGWVKTAVEPLWYSRFFSSPLNVAGPVTTYTFPFAEQGLIDAFTLNTVGLVKAELWLSGQLVLNLPGAAFGAAIGDMFRALQIPYNATTLTNPICQKVNLGLPAQAGNSKLVVSATAGWLATNEFGVHSIVPQVKAA